jgi:hypothetical protein
MTEAKKTAIHSESLATWAIRFRELVAAAREDGYTLSLEDADTDYPYVDLEKRTDRRVGGSGLLMVAVIVEDDYWECECGHSNYEDGGDIDECEACGRCRE